MAIVKVKLMNQYTRRDGTQAVVIYVYENKPKYIYTDYSVLPDQFREGQSNWIRKHPNAIILNAKIEDLRQEVINSIIPGVGYVKGAQNAGESANFCDYLCHRAKQYKDNEQIDMGLKMIRLAKEISISYGRDIYFQEINMDFIRAYVAWCKQQKWDDKGIMQPGNVKNTIMRKVKNMRNMYEQAINDGKAPYPNPFNKFKITLDKTKANKYSRDEIRRIEQLDLLPESFIWHVRNAFIFSFFCQGMRFEKVCTLKWDNVYGDVIKYQQGKGSNAREIEIHPALRAILNLYMGSSPYIFPFFKKEPNDKAELRSMKGGANAKANEFLKYIGQMAKLQTPLRFHEARGSFAMLAKKKGTPTSTIQDALGHATEKQTQDYLDKHSDDDINDAIRAVWD